MQSSNIGQIAENCWREIPSHFENVRLDEFVIMPNHIHGIIHLNGTTIVGAGHVQPTNEQIHTSRYQHLVSKSLSSILGSFKSSVSRICNQNQLKESIWQRNFYEHVIRNEFELNSIREYIIHNPLQWELDRENPLSRNYDLELEKYFCKVYLNA